MAALAAPELPTTALADTAGLSGNDLWTYCDAPSTAAPGKMDGNGALCDGYIAGALSMLRLMRNGESKFYCAPPDVPVPQEIDVVKSFLRDAPDQRQFAASSLVLVAMNRAYPCAPANPPPAK